MHKSISLTPPCDQCSLSLFCEPEEVLHPQQNKLSVKRYRYLQRNEVLYLSKNKFQHLYMIQRGVLKTYQVEADGKELIRGFYFAGETLGYEAIYSGHYLFSAIALSETFVCEIPYEHFLKSIQSTSSLQKQALYLLSKQLHVGSYLASTTAEQRLAAFLIDLSVRLHPSKRQLQFFLPMSRHDIGSYLRLTAETVSRLFSRLQKSNVITIKHKKINLVELDKLQLIADGLLSVCH